MSTYVINGPTTIGDTGALNEILGDVSLTDITTTQGNVLSVDASGNLSAVATGTANQVLTSNGAGAEPTFQNVPGATDENFAVDKDGGDTFSNTPTVVANWNTTATYRYNTGSFNTTTGVFTVANTGKFSFKATISYTNTGGSGNSGSRTLELYDTTNATVIASVTDQPGGSNSIDHYLTIDTDATLTAADTVALRFYRSNASGTNSILATSTFSGHFII